MNGKRSSNGVISRAKSIIRFDVLPFVFANLDAPVPVSVIDNPKTSSERKRARVCVCLSVCVFGLGPTVNLVRSGPQTSLRQTHGVRSTTTYVEEKKRRHHNRCVCNDCGSGPLARATVLDDHY